MEKNKMFDIAGKKIIVTGGSRELDVLVNGAGVQYRCEALDFPLEQWNRVLAVNLTSVFQLSQLAAKIMVKRGKGKIINIASIVSWFGGTTVPAYTASNGAVIPVDGAYLVK